VVLADTMAIFFVFVGLLLAFPSLWLLCRGLWTDKVVACADRAGKGLIKSFFAGVPLTAGAIILAGAVGKLGSWGQVGAILTVSSFLLFANTGVSGLATYIGRRLPSPADAERPWKRTLRGGIVLELSYLLPLLGWFFILPASMVIGCGTLMRVIIFPDKARSDGPSLAASVDALQHMGINVAQESGSGAAHTTGAGAIKAVSE
jgi:hypothetical protein